MLAVFRAGRRLKISYIFLLLIAYCFIISGGAGAATGAEIKQYCKNKCQYILQKNCYEECVRSGATVTGPQVGEKKEKNWEDLVKEAEDFFKSDDYENAVTIYEQLIVMDPLASIAHYNLGICYENLGKYSSAILEYQKYLEVKPYAEDRPEVESWIRRLSNMPPRNGSAIRPTP
jgi:tetratricopeptide (TPR) repeat protein